MQLSLWVIIYTVQCNVFIYLFYVLKSWNQVYFTVHAQMNYGPYRCCSYFYTSFWLSSINRDNAQWATLCVQRFELDLSVAKSTVSFTFPHDSYCCESSSAWNFHIAQRDRLQKSKRRQQKVLPPSFTTNILSNQTRHSTRINVGWT